MLWDWRWYFIKHEGKTKKYKGRVDEVYKTIPKQDEIEEQEK